MMRSEYVELIRKCFWDYGVEEGEIRQKAADLERGIVSDEHFFRRILDTLHWFDLIQLIPLETLLDLLTAERLQKLRSQRRRENFANARSILRGKALPFSRWDHLDAERARHGFFPRWGYGDVEPFDALENILVNKLTALGRYEPKDVADTWIIAKNSSFCWKQRFVQASKRTWMSRRRNRPAF